MKDIRFFSDSHTMLAVIVDESLNICISSMGRVMTVSNVDTLIADLIKAREWRNRKYQEMIEKKEAKAKERSKKKKEKK